MTSSLSFLLYRVSFVNYVFIFIFHVRILADSYYPEGPMCNDRKYAVTGVDPPKKLSGESEGVRVIHPHDSLENVAKYCGFGM